VAQSGSKPLRYEIRVKGKLTDDDLGSLDDGLSAHVETGGTVLVGDVVDRAALHGLLHRLRALGVELVEMRRVPTDWS
jgi:hypothetical protein